MMMMLMMTACRVMMASMDMDMSGHGSRFSQGINGSSSSGSSNISGTCVVLFVIIL